MHEYFRSLPPPGNFGGLGVHPLNRVLRSIAPDPEYNSIFDFEIEDYLPEEQRQLAREFSRAARDATRDWITQQCSKEGIDTIPSNHYDAFGHCWYGCQAERSIFPGAGTVGWFRELAREAGWKGEHDSFWEDIHNENEGIYYSLWEGSCSTIWGSFDERSGKVR